MGWFWPREALRQRTAELPQCVKSAPPNHHATEPEAQAATRTSDTGCTPAIVSHGDRRHILLHSSLTLRRDRTLDPRLVLRPSTSSRLHAPGGVDLQQTLNPQPSSLNPSRPRAGPGANYPTVRVLPGPDLAGLETPETLRREGR
eukprot:1033982-Rhodomonas_salina.4